MLKGIMPDFERQWHLHGRGSRANVDPRSAINCVQAWAAVGMGSPEVVIAVVDDGCQLDHPAFGGAAKFAGCGFPSEEGISFRRDVSEIDALDAPGCTHGTSMCSLIAGTGDAGTFGVAPRCRLLPVRLPASDGRVSISNESFTNILQIISDHADIAVLSFSRKPLLVLSREVSELIEWSTAVGGRRKKGLLFVCPAGNSNCPLDGEVTRALPFAVSTVLPNYTEGRVFTSRTFRNSMCKIPGVLHVAAISSLAKRAFYSCYGWGIDLCAPSSNSRVFVGDIVPGTGLGLTVSYGPNGEVTNNFKGSSGAAGLVAGVAGLVLSANPDLSAEQIRSILVQTSSRDVDVEGVERYLPELRPWEISPQPPYNSGEFDQSGWSPWFGFGKVDASAAVELALRLRRTEYSLIR
ncbi:S8 family serine peptidase [Bradyrhizobium ottawaense]